MKKTKQFSTMNCIGIGMMIGGVFIMYEPLGFIVLGLLLALNTSHKTVEDDEPKSDT